MSSIVGYIVIIKKKSSSKYESLAQYEALSYPGPDSSFPNMLLRGCGATIFNTKEKAEFAIKDTKSLAKKRDCEWVNKWDFGTLTVYRQ